MHVIRKLAFESLYVGQFKLSTRLVNQIIVYRCSTLVSSETQYPLMYAIHGGRPVPCRTLRVA